MEITKLVLGALGTNCYIAVDEATRKCAVIDPAADASGILRACRLAASGLKPEKILLTHAHFDHFGALNELCGYGCDGSIGINSVGGLPFPEVYIGEYDMAGLTTPELNLSLSFAGFPMKFMGKAVPLSDGDTVTVGESTLKVIETPGHTPGSICFFDEKDGNIFSGDTVFAGSIGRTDFPGGNYSAIIESLEKVLKLDGKTVVYPGHGEPTTVEKERMTNPYFTR